MGDCGGQMQGDLGKYFVICRTILFFKSLGSEFKGLSLLRKIHAIHTLSLCWVPPSDIYGIQALLQTSFASPFFNQIPCFPAR